MENMADFTILITEGLMVEFTLPLFKKLGVTVQTPFFLIPLFRITKIGCHQDQEDRKWEKSTKDSHGR